MRSDWYTAAYRLTVAGVQLRREGHRIGCLCGGYLADLVAFRNDQSPARDGSAAGDSTRVHDYEPMEVSTMPRMCSPNSDGVMNVIRESFFSIDGASCSHSNISPIAEAKWISKRNRKLC
jgi:hypothetical protein